MLKFLKSNLTKIGQPLHKKVDQSANKLKFWTLIYVPLYKIIMNSETPKNIILSLHVIYHKIKLKANFIIL